ncbi:hypothetical protein ACJX0J_038919 [Zea mays]
MQAASRRGFDVNMLQKRYDAGLHWPELFIQPFIKRERERERERERFDRFDVNMLQKRYDAGLHWPELKRERERERDRKGMIDIRQYYNMIRLITILAVTATAVAIAIVFS